LDSSQCPQQNPRVGSPFHRRRPPRRRRFIGVSRQTPATNGETNHTTMILAARGEKALNQFLFFTPSPPSSPSTWFWFILLLLHRLIFILVLVLASPSTIHLHFLGFLIFFQIVSMFEMDGMVRLG
jgi:hypothetical protein